MSLKEQGYSVLVVSASETINNAISALLPESKYSPIRFVSSVSAARRAFAEHADMGVRFAIDACSAKGTVVLLLVRAELHDEIYDKVAEHGVFTLAKPTAKPTILIALGWMSSARERLRKSEKKTLSIEEKMEEIRIVNKAKWLLIRELKMDEPQAHRYIEKQAMDRCVTRREIAEDIIRIYH